MMYSWIFDGSSWKVVLTLTSPQPPSFYSAFNLRVLDLGWKPSCLVRSFLFLMSPLEIWLSHQCIQWLGVGVDCLDHLLPILLTTQYLPYSLQVFGGWNFCSSLFVVPICLWYSKVLIAVLSVYNVSVYIMLGPVAVKLFISETLYWTSATVVDTRSFSVRSLWSVLRRTTPPRVHTSEASGMNSLLYYFLHHTFLCFWISNFPLFYLGLGLIISPGLSTSDVHLTSHFN